MSILLRDDCKCGIEGDVVLDNAAGSGTTGVAAKTTGRKYILIEKEDKYAAVCERRIANTDSVFGGLE